MSRERSAISCRLLPELSKFLCDVGEVECTKKGLKVLCSFLLKKKLCSSGVLLMLWVLTFLRPTSHELNQYYRYKFIVMNGQRTVWICGLIIGLDFLFSLKRKVAAIICEVKITLDLNCITTIFKLYENRWDRPHTHVLWIIHREKVWKQEYKFSIE